MRGRESFPSDGIWVFLGETLFSSNPSWEFPGATRAEVSSTDAVYPVCAPSSSWEPCEPTSPPLWGEHACPVHPGSLACWPTPALLFLRKLAPPRRLTGSREEPTRSPKPRLPWPSSASSHLCGPGHSLVSSSAEGGDSPPVCPIGWAIEVSISGGPGRPLGPSSHDFPLILPRPGPAPCGHTQKPRVGPVGPGPSAW